jgi:D-psicose/D-tagatose/L-ribulose 3-epimerase
MTFGASTFIWVSPFSNEHFELVHKVKKMGYDILEVAVEDKDIIDWSKLKVIAQDADVKLTISGAFGPDRDISSSDPQVRKQGLQYIVDCIRIAEKMGSPVFTGPVYSAVGKTRLVPNAQKMQEREWCIDNLRKAAKVASDCGVIVGVEPLNRFETDMVNTADQALSLVDEVSDANIRISLDTFHCNIEEKSIPDAIRKVGTHLCHLQGNECDRGTPGTGHLDWVGINKALNEIGYSGAVVIETFGAPSAELARAASIWRPLADSPDALAREGLEFFQKVLR